MCALALLASKCRSKLNFPGAARLLSASSHETCEIRTFYGTRKYDARRFVPLLEHCQRYPILNRVPEDRLISSVDPDNPFLTSEAGRFLSRSALMLPFISHLHGKSVVGSFEEGNVGVLRGTGVLCFKQICFGALNSNARATAYQEAAAFLKELIRRVHGDWALDHLPPDLLKLLAKLEAKTVEDEEDLLYDGCLCPDNIRAYVQFETWRLARKEFPAIGKRKKAERIQRDIESECRTYQTVCKNNVFLSTWGAPNPFNTTQSSPAPSPTGAKKAPLNTTAVAVPSQSSPALPSQSSPAPSPTGKNLKSTKSKKKNKKKKKKKKFSKTC